MTLKTVSISVIIKRRSNAVCIDIEKPVVDHMLVGTSFLSAIISMEILSAVVCLILIIGNELKNRNKTRRARWFSASAACTIVGCVSDAISIMLDGSGAQAGLSFVISLLSMLSTLLLIGMFVSYLTAYISEREAIETTAVKISWSFVAISIIVTIACAFTGELYYFENGAFQAGPLYPAYLLFNTSGLLIGVATIVKYQNALDFWDKIASYTYVAFPAIAGLVSAYSENLSFTYPAIMLSELVVYAMINSDRLKTLERKGEIDNYYAMHDELTGLNNRRALNDTFAELLSSNNKCGVVFSDINGLKYTNDHFGHEAGDGLIVRYSRILSEFFRTSEIYRISGDEFVCVLVDITEKAFDRRMSDLAKAIGEEEPPIASIGDSYGYAHTIKQLIQDAEAKMYLAKEQTHRQFLLLNR